MTEEFVSLELAKKLKEEGYNKPFYFYYRTDDECIHHVNTCAPLVYSDKIDDEVVIAPTISQVLKWLREEKNLHIAVDVYELGWFYEVTHYGKGSRSNLICTQSVPNLSEPDFDSYEEAALAGIEYVIDNLI